MLQKIFIRKKPVDGCGKKMVAKKNVIKNQIQQGLIKLSGNEFSTSFIYQSTFSTQNLIAGQTSHTFY